MLGKQFKILNNKLNSLLQIQEDIGGWNSVSGIEVDAMLKSYENRLKMVMEQIEKKHEECLNPHVENFQFEVTKIRDIAKERHILFFWGS